MSGKPPFNGYYFAKDLSILIPLFNEEESLPELCEWISRVAREMGIQYEILLVDDGSTDDSWKEIQSLWERYPTIRAFRFGRNYGKSAALDLAFQQSEGRVVITMDADLQDSPDEIPKLYRKIEDEGFDLVSGWKQKRFDPISKTIPSKLFNKVTSMVSGIKLHDFNCGLKAYHSRVIKTIHLYGEMHRYIPVIARQNGFRKIGEMVVEHGQENLASPNSDWKGLFTGFWICSASVLFPAFGKDQCIFSAVLVHFRF